MLKNWRHPEPALTQSQEKTETNKEKKNQLYKTNLIYQNLIFLNYNSFSREKEPGLPKKMHAHYFPNLMMLVYPSLP